MNIQCELRSILAVSPRQLLGFILTSVVRTGEITVTELLVKHLLLPSAICAELRALHLWQRQVHSKSEVLGVDADNPDYV